jgi:hypothetical protein
MKVQTVADFCLKDVGFRRLPRSMTIIVHYESADCPSGILLTVLNMSTGEQARERLFVTCDTINNGDANSRWQCTEGYIKEATTRSRTQ